jgi:hypothetical protein
MRALYIYIVMFLAALPLMISGAYAIGISVTAGSSGSDSVGFSTVHDDGDNAQLTDSAVLSFNDGAGMNRQISASGDKVNIFDTQVVQTLDKSMAACVTVNVIQADSATYTITLDPKQVTTKTTKVSASGTLTASNADSIYASANSSNAKGDYAEQRIKITSLSRAATLTGYINKATADKTSATATQAFKYASTDGTIDILGSSWVMYGTDVSYMAQNCIKFTGSGRDRPLAEIGTPTSTVASFTGTSTTKSENRVSAIASATSLKGMNFTFTGDSFNSEGYGTTVNDNITGNTSRSEGVRRAEIRKYSISMSAISSAASEKRSYGSISAGQVNISEFAMNAQNDLAGHYLDANSYWKSGLYYPVLIDSYCAQTSDGFKAQKTSVTGGVSIVGASGAYLALFSQAAHTFSDDTSDYCVGQVSGSMTSLDKPKSGQAYKLTLTSGAKATSLTYGTIRGKGTDYGIFTQAYSSALDDSMIQMATTTKPIGKIYTATATTKSSGKAGDAKGASASTNIKFTSTY